MVSTRVLAALTVAGASLFAQTNSAPDRPAPEAQQGLLPAPPEPDANLTPERRGDILMARKRYREAIESYRQAGLESAAIVNKIGIAYHQMLDLKSARKQYERAIKINPSYPEAINNLGTVFYSQKNYRRAISQYNRALKLQPDSASIYSNLGTALFARKNYQEAMDAYQKAVALDPDVFEHRGTWGAMLQERTVGERAKFHYYLAKTYAKAGLAERALLYLRKSLEEGFKERRKIPEEPEFQPLKDMPEFQELLKLEPRVL